MSFPNRNSNVNFWITETDRNWNLERSSWYKSRKYKHKILGRAKQGGSDSSRVHSMLNSEAICDENGNPSTWQKCEKKIIPYKKSYQNLKCSAHKFVGQSFQDCVSVQLRI